MSRLPAVLLGLAAALVWTLSPVARAQEEVPEATRAHLEEAERAKEAGKVEEAIRSYRLALAAAPDYTPAHTALGAFLAEKGRGEEALAAFQEGLARAPRDRTLLFNSAAVSLQLGKAEEALRFAERIVLEAPKEASAKTLKGTILRRLERREEALAAYQEAARLEPRSAQAHFNVGLVLHELRRDEESVQAFRKALERDSSFTKAQYNLGTVLFGLGRDEEAIGAYEGALAPVEADLAKGRPVDAVHARAFANLGALYLKRSRWEKSLAAYEKAARLDPKDPGLDYNLGFLHYQLGHEREAVTRYTAALEGNPELPVALLHLGLIAEKGGSADEAKARLTKALPLLDREGRREARLALARLDLRSQDAGAAETHLLALLQESTEDAAALLALGRLQRTTGRLADAERTLEKARRAAPENASVLLELAAVARQAGDVPRERGLYEQLLARPGRGEERWAVRVNLALTNLEAAPGEARRELEAAMREAPAAHAASVPRLKAILALLAAREGRQDEAARALRRLSAESPGNASLRRAVTALDASEGKAPVPSGAEGSRGNRVLAAWAAGSTPSADEIAELERTFPAWWGVAVAAGERALRDGHEDEAIEPLGLALAACDAGAKPPGATSTPGMFSAVLGGREAGGAGSAAGRLPSRSSLCARAQTLAASAFLRRAARALEESAKGGEVGQARYARSLAERAAKLPLDPASRATALFIVGTADLLLGNTAPARDSLTQALAGKLPVAFVPLARANLGVALARAGVGEEALRELRAARAAAPGLAEATLNLALRLDEAGRGAEALALYEELLLKPGFRRDDVAARARALREIYP